MRKNWQSGRYRVETTVDTLEPIEEAEDDLETAILVTNHNIIPTIVGGFLLNTNPKTNGKLNKTI